MHDPNKYRSHYRRTSAALAARKRTAQAFNCALIGAAVLALAIIAALLFA